MIHMKQQLTSFVIRWLLSSLGLWVSVKLFGTGVVAEAPASLVAYLFAGFIFSIVNAVLRPVIIILSLPVLLVTLGLFMFIVNGFLVYVSLKLAPGITMTFPHAILAGAVIGLVNYIVTDMFSLSPKANLHGEGK